MFSVLLRWIPVERLCPTEVTSEPAIVFHNFIFCFFLRLHAQTNFISFTVIGPGNSRNVFLKGFQKEKKMQNISFSVSTDFSLREIQSFSAVSSAFTIRCRTVSCCVSTTRSRGFRISFSAVKCCVMADRAESTASLCS